MPVVGGGMEEDTPETTGELMEDASHLLLGSINEMSYSKSIKNIYFQVEQ